MKIGAEDKEKIESMVEYRYRTERKSFWFAGEHYMWCTQQEYDDYVKSLPGQQRKFEKRMNELKESRMAQICVTLSVEATELLRKHLKERHGYYQGLQSGYVNNLIVKELS